MDTRVEILDPSLEEVACIAACLVDLSRPEAAVPDSAWAAAARFEGLRG
jgi:hypothetical protein